MSELLCHQFSLRKQVVWKAACIVLCCSVAFADEQKKTEKPPTPREIREAAEKSIKDKMAPIEKKLAEKKEDLGHARKAPPMGGNSVGSSAGPGRTMWVSFRNAEKKSEVIAKYEAEIKELNAQLKPLQDELTALKKKPLVKPEEKPKPQK